MIDYQFLGIVALGLAVMTRGSVVPVLTMTAVVALVSVVYEAGVRRFRARHDGPPPGAAGDPPPPSEAELSSWLTVVDRCLRSRD